MKKEKLLLCGENEDVLDSLKQHLGLAFGSASQYDVIGTVLWQPPGSSKKYDIEEGKKKVAMIMLSDFLLCPVFCIIGKYLHATGVNLLKLNHSEPVKKTLAYGFNIPSGLVRNPLIWDVFGENSLLEKLAVYETLTKLEIEQALGELVSHFKQHLKDINHH